MHRCYRNDAMKTLALAIVGIATLSGCMQFGPRVTDAGKPATKNVAVGSGKELGSFTKVSSKGALDVEIKQGANSNVVVEGDENIVKIVKLKVVGDTLEVNTEGNYTTSTRLVVKITMPKIEGIDLSGSGNTTVSGVTADDLDLDISGSGNIKIDGTAKKLSASVSGSGIIEANTLEAQDAEADISGSGSIMVFATKNLEVDIAGSGEVRYKGSPSLKKDITGSGEVVKQ